MVEVKDLKYYAEQFQNGNSDVFEDLISYRVYREKNGYGKYDNNKRIIYTDKLLNRIYDDIKRLYINDVNIVDLESWFLEFVYTHLLVKINITYDSKQIASWVSKRSIGFIRDKIRKDQKYLSLHKLTSGQKNDNYDNFDENDDRVSLNKFDEQEANNWIYNIGEYKFYDEFIKSIGSIKNILTPQQYSLYELLLSEYSQERIAELYGCSQENVSKQKKIITRKIKRQFFTYKVIQKTKTKNTYTDIENILTNYFLITDYADNKFNWFGYLLESIIKNYNNEQKEQEDFNYIQQNKRDFSVTIIDILSEYMTKKQWLTLHKHLRNEVKIGTNREKARMVNYIIKALLSYSGDIKEKIYKYYEVCQNKVEKIAK